MNTNFFAASLDKFRTDIRIEVFIAGGISADIGAKSRFLINEETKH
jgi:hypothetical protein